MGAVAIVSGPRSRRSREIDTRSAPMVRPAVSARVSARTGRRGVRASAASNRRWVGLPGSTTEPSGMTTWIDPSIRTRMPPSAITRRYCRPADRRLGVGNR